MDLNGVLYGGVVNKPEDAVSFAYALMRSKPGLAPIPKEALLATEQHKIWHISARVPGQSKPSEIMTFARYDGRLLSGDL